MIAGSDDELASTCIEGGAFDLKALATMLQPMIKEACKEACKSALDEVGTRIQGVEERVKVVEGWEPRIKALEDVVANRGGGGGGVGPGAANPRGDFQPQYLELKGWCTWDDRKENGITRKQADRLVTSLKSELPEGMPQFLGDLMLRGLYNYSVRLKVLDLEKAMELRGCLTDILKSSPEKYLTNKKTPYCVAETLQEVQQKFRKLGGIIECTKRARTAKGLDQDIEVVPEFSSCSVYIEVAGQDRPVLIGDIERDGAARFLEKNINKYFHMPVDEFKEYMGRQ